MNALRSEAVTPKPVDKPTSGPASAPTAAPLLEVDAVVKHIPLSRAGFLQKHRAVVRAVDGVSLRLGSGETLGLVGESGCGKSTLGKLVMRLIEPTSGRLRFEGRDMLDQSPAALHAMRRRLQMVFQNPYGSLNPRMSVADAIDVPLRAYEGGTRAARRPRVNALLEQVGLNAAQGDRYPHEFSGGQRQRIAIARAMALHPRLIVCDEAVSALDASVQAHVLNLLQDLQASHGLSYLFISHDLAVVRHVSDRVAVMYLGKIIETGAADEIFLHPQHPYTLALLDAVPVSHPDHRRVRTVLQGQVPSPIDVPSGCRFRTRCPVATARCAVEEPAMRALSDQHAVACHLVGEA